jgi:hypothetical protein
MGRSEADPFQPVDFAAGTEQFRERLTVTEFHPVRVDVLPKKCDLLNSFSDQRPDLGQNLAWPAVGFATTQRWDDAEGAGVVAAHADGHPGRISRLPVSRQIGRKGFQGFLDLDLRLVLDSGTFQQHR